MLSSAPCWSCNLSSVNQRVGGDVPGPPHKVQQGMVSGVEDSGWAGLLARGLHQAWEAGLFTDLTIVTRDEVIRAHKVVLAAASPYFRAMLSGCLVEGRTHTLELKHVPSCLLNVVLTYVYAGHADLTPNNVQEVLTLADYFQIHALKKLCCYHLKANLVTDTCLSVYEVASLHRCHDLAVEAVSLAAHRCSEVLASPSLLALQPDTLLALLKQPYLNVDSEEELLKGITHWALHDPDERMQWVPTLWHELDLSGVKREAVIKYADLLEAKGAEVPGLTVEREEEEEKEKRRSRCISQEEVLLVMGGESNGRLLGNTECFAVGYSSWRCSIPEVAARHDNRPSTKHQVLPVMSHARAHCAVATRDNVVYVLGGQTNKEFLASCERYSVTTNAWTSLCDLPRPVHGIAAAFLDGDLYVAGGKTTTYEDRLWVYDEHGGCWRARGAMACGRAHLGMAALYGSLYAVGGQVGVEGGGGQVVATCEKFDPGSDTWVPIASLSQARAYHGVTVINDHIYAIGGYDGSRWLSSVERYDPLRDQWTTVSSMISPRSSFGVTVSRGRIYCLGGFSGESNLNTVEKYNPRTDMWHCVQSMQLRRYGLVAATVKVPGPANT